MMFNGNPQTVNPEAWIAVNCGHEVQINDSPDGPPNDPRKTGSIYGFADLNAAQARTTPVGGWNDLEIRVVGQHYTVIRNGVTINEYENLPGVPFPARPNDPDSSYRGRPRPAATLPPAGVCPQPSSSQPRRPHLPAAHLMP
jgi:hypothetical protein